MVQQIKAALRKELEKLPEGSKKREQMLKECDKEARTLQELLHLTPNMMEFLYKEGMRQYQLKNYKEASSTFQVLHMLQPADYRFSFSTGASFHMLKEYEKAKYWYMIANYLTEENQLILYHLADCYIKTNDPVTAKLLLENAIDRCSTVPKLALLKERMTLILKGMGAT